MKKLIEKLIARPLHAILSTALAVLLTLFLSEQIRFLASLEMTGSKWIEMTR
jgi:hypothetical protein